MALPSQYHYYYWLSIATLSASLSINKSLAKSAQEGTKARKQSILEKIPKGYHDKRWDNI